MKKSLPFVLVLIFLCASCAKDKLFDPPARLPGNSSPYNLISPQIRIAVVSDIHYMDPTIAPDDPENNAEWQSMVNHDRKIFEFSDPIFRKVVSDLKYEKPDILLITGDLAMEGQLVSHQAVKTRLQELENAGIRVFVVPGNNDIDNPDAKEYKTFTKVSSITPEDFASLYGDFGFYDEETLYRDANSLSYICQPFEHLWILGIDCKNGAIDSSTLEWIQEKMVEANEKNITVLAMMHYGIIEHYPGQNTLEPLVYEPNVNALALMSVGIRLIFTGHYHANDIANYTENGMTLSDIQTGSLVTPPYSFRMMTLDDNFINIDTRRVTSEGTDIPEDTFLKYSNEIFTDRITGFFTFYGSFLRWVYQIPKAQYPLTIPIFTEAYKAYFAGDEKLDAAERMKIVILGQSVPSALPLLDAMWNDPAPKDNKIHIKLK